MGSGSGPGPAELPTQTTRAGDSRRPRVGQGSALVGLGVDVSTTRSLNAPLGVQTSVRILSGAPKMFCAVLKRFQRIRAVPATGGSCIGVTLKRSHLRRTERHSEHAPRAFEVVSPRREVRTRVRCLPVAGVAALCLALCATALVAPAPATHSIWTVLIQWKPEFIGFCLWFYSVWQAASVEWLPSVVVDFSY